MMLKFCGTQHFVEALVSAVRTLVQVAWVMVICRGMECAQAEKKVLFWHRTCRGSPLAAPVGNQRYHSRSLHTPLYVLGFYCLCGNVMVILYASSSLTGVTFLQAKAWSQQNLELLLQWKRSVKRMHSRRI